MPATRPRAVWVLLGVVAAFSGPGQHHARAGCVFDCRNATALCGGWPDIVPFTVARGTAPQVGRAVNQTVSTVLERLPALNLTARGISTIAPHGLSCWSMAQDVRLRRGDVWIVLLDGNPLGGLPRGEHLRGGNGFTPQIVSMTDCSLTQLPPRAFVSYTRYLAGDDCYGVSIDLSLNNVSALPSELLNGLEAPLSLSLSSNRIATPLTRDLFEKSGGLLLDLNVSDNLISAVPALALYPSEGVTGGSGLLLEGGILGCSSFANFSAANCSCSPGYVLDHHCGFVRCTTANGGCPAGTLFDVTDCSHAPNSTCLAGGSVATLSPTPSPSPHCAYHCLYSPCGVTHELIWVAFRRAPDRDNWDAVPTLDLSSRGITSLQEGAFSCFQMAITYPPFDDELFAVILDNNPLLTLPNGSVFSGADGLTQPPIISMQNCGIDHLPYAAFSGYYNPALWTVVYLNHNSVTALSPGVFAGLTPRSQETQPLFLWLENNSISSLINASTFADIREQLWLLVLSGNAITAVPTVTAYPTFYGTFMETGSVLSCASFGVSTKTGLTTATDCRCANGYHLLTLCQYTVCSRYATGCPPDSFLNSSDCTNGPIPACVNAAIAVNDKDAYYNTAKQVFLPLTDCATAFPRDFNNSGSQFLRAYQYKAATPTTDRRCSICSGCPPGYYVEECTAFRNTRCNMKSALSAGDAAAITLSILLLMGAVWYFRRGQERQKRALGETQTYLELTEQLLGDEREVKAQMGQAWLIEENDLQFGNQIGRGAFGRVHRGVWGHIPVAIKVLHLKLDGTDPQIVNDFDREVSLMRTIRHPNLLTFYGAGIDTEDRAYLVTELMAHGSLKQLLYDEAAKLDWSMRIQFVADTTAGMRYLHDRGVVHRDLKADNLFLDASLRVKIADFGASKMGAPRRSRLETGAGERGLSPLSSSLSSSITSEMSFGPDDRQVAPGRLRERLASESKAQSKGMGSLLWMSPEVLQGLPIPEAEVKAVDVYSFGVVMWEIWARAQPWREIQSKTQLSFSSQLQDRVVAGDRPTLQGCGDAPVGYRALMEACWASAPADRPPFEMVHARAVRIRDSLAPVYEVAT